MCCSYGVIPRSDPSFSILPVPYKLSITPSWVHVARSSVPIRTRTGSFRTWSSTINDGGGGTVASPPTEELTSFYELLGISSEGTAVEIKQAYKQLARKYHPDVSPPGRAEEYTRRFIQVQEAYETLSDPGRRAMYDRDMARGIHLAFSARRRFQSDQVFL